MTVASLVPAATDLIIGMGAADKLVGVSNYDPARPETTDLPRVGDYRTIDWELLADLQPAILIVQFRPDKMPAGTEEKAAEYGIQLVNVRLDRLADIFHSLAQVGDAIGEPAKAKEAADKLRAQLDVVHTRVANRPIVLTYLGRGSDPLEAVGGGNYLNDLLELAGGQNVLHGPGYSTNSYPRMDREQLRVLNPQVAINLLPSASPQVVDQAKAFWATMGDVAAMQTQQVHYLTEPYLLWPGMSVGKVAERLADELHPETRPWTPRSDTQPVVPATQPGTVSGGASVVSPLAGRGHGRDAHATSMRLLEIA